MSHNYQNRRLPDSDLRPDPARYNAEADGSFYRRPQEPFSSSFRSSAMLQRGPSPQDGVVSLLNSCGLEPEDLAVLAKLPEEALTVESLPQIIRQIKGKKGTVKHFPSRAPSPSSSHPSYSLSSSHRLPAGSASRDWDQYRRQPVQYPLQCIAPTVPPSEMLLDSLGVHRTSSCVRPPSSSSSRPTLDYDRRPRPPEFGKAVSSYSSGEPRKGTRPSRFSDAKTADYKAVPPPEERSRRSGSSSSSRSATRMPSKNQALDFHGTNPPMFPYSCSLCEITVLSEKVWIQHINSTIHANGQLKLLQQFPDWDCRVKTVNRDGDQSERRKDEASTAPSAQRASHSQAAPQTDKKQQKASDKGRVVCVKFPAQSVNETYLRKLIEPFGKIVKMLLFPSVAFVELGSADQAKDLVKFHSAPAANKEQIEFSISHTFSFLQSSLVVSFTPAPTGEDGRSDLISIVKRFGEPLYTLFLPSKAFVEMKFAADAQKLVDYYSSNTLRLNRDSISVSFSSEYKSLMRVALAKKYEQEPATTTESGSKESSQDSRTSSWSRGEDRSRTRSRSKSRDKSRAHSRQDNRSRDKSSREERTRTRSRSRSKSKDKSSKETSTRSKEASIDRSSRSRSKERSSSISVRQNQSEEKTEEPQRPDTENRAKEEPEDVSTDAAEQMEDEKNSSAEKSDIEGMEVTPEDGQKAEGEDVETLERRNEMKETTCGREEERKNMEGAYGKEEDLADEEKLGPEEEKMSGLKKQEEEEETADSQKIEEHGEQEALLDLENEDGAEHDGGSESSPGSSRVLFFSTMPLNYTDQELIKVMRGFGTVVRYLLIHNRQQALVEMSTPSEAQQAAKDLQSEPVHISGSRLIGSLSHKHSGLLTGWLIPSDEEEEKKSRCRRSGRLNKSGLSEPDETNDSFEGTKETLTKPSEKTWDTGTTERTSDRKTRSNKSPEKNDDGDKTSETRSKITPEEKTENLSEEETRTDRKTRSNKSPKEDESQNSSEKKPKIMAKQTAEKTSDRKTRSKKTPEKEMPEKEVSETTPEDTWDKTSEEELKKNTEKDVMEGKTPRRTSRKGTKTRTEKRKGTAENNEVPLKTQRTEPREETGQNNDPEEPELPEEQKPASDTEERRAGGEKSTRVCSEKETSPPQVENSQNLDSSEPPQQEAQLQQQSTPAEGATEPQEPTKPVGSEFVRPVVGYFCNLCQLIFSDEDEAKLQHCSTADHYRKYQEKTGKDPWTS